MYLIIRQLEGWWMTLRRMNTKLIRIHFISLLKIEYFLRARVGNEFWNLLGISTNEVELQPVKGKSGIYV